MNFYFLQKLVFYEIIIIDFSLLEITTFSKKVFKNNQKSYSTTFCKVTNLSIAFRHMEKTFLSSYHLLISPFIQSFFVNITNDDVNQQTF